MYRNTYVLILKVLIVGVDIIVTIVNVISNKDIIMNVSCALVMSSASSNRY
jgi:hypothetical protein